MIWNIFDFIVLDHLPREVEDRVFVWFHRLCRVDYKHKGRVEHLAKRNVDSTLKNPEMIHNAHSKSVVGQLYMILLQPCHLGLVPSRSLKILGRTCIDKRRDTCKHHHPSSHFHPHHLFLPSPHPDCHLSSSGQKESGSAASGLHSQPGARGGSHWQSWPSSSRWRWKIFQFCSNKTSFEFWPGFKNMTRFHKIHHTLPLFRWVVWWKTGCRKFM